MKPTLDENVLRQAARILLATLKRSSLVALKSEKPMGRNCWKALVSMFLASSICLMCDSAGYAQEQSAAPVVPSSTSTPNSNPGVNSRQPQDDFLNSLINLPKKHQGRIAYDDISAIFMHKMKCVNDTYFESSELPSDKKHIKGIWVKSHCPGGMRVEYVGETRLQERGNFKYRLAINWYPSSKAECIPAEHVVTLIKANGWNFPPVNPPPGASQEVNEGLSNYQPFQSSAAGDAMLVFLWSLPVGNHSMMAVPIGQSCLASLIFSAHQ